MRVRVDEAGEEHAARHIDDLALRGERGRDVADPFDLFPIDEHVGAAAAASADHKASAKQRFHIDHSLSEKHDSKLRSA